MKVKPLEWKDYPGSRLTGESKERYGLHEFGSYVITRGEGVYSLSTFTNMGAMRPMAAFKQLDDATAAAQADFDQRILSIVTTADANQESVALDRWQLVPKDLTPDMIEALGYVRQPYGSTMEDNADDIWTAMLSAAPAPAPSLVGQSAKIWPGQTVETVIREMIAVAAGEYEGSDETLDPWTSDNRADIDRWQCIISDAALKSEGWADA